MLHPHRSIAETFQVMRRTGYWPTLAADTERYCAQCQTCVRFRSHAVMGPYRSALSDDRSSSVLPWSDVVIDVQGPFTRAEGGEVYVLAYLCTKLKVPYLYALKTIQHGPMSRALSTCAFRSRRMPDILRSDRGPEFTNFVIEEFMALMNIRHIKGASLTPRHQGLGEKEHQNMMTDLMILLREVTKAHPSEWAALIPAVEYVLWTAPKGPHGFSALDFDSAYSLATSVDVALQPFMIPSGTPETDTMARAFTAWSDLFTIVQRVTREKAELRMREENMSRMNRHFEEGEVVFMKNPKGSRLPKHLLNQPCNGPYEVVSQPTTTSLILKDPETQAQVRGGAYIPLDQVVTGPRQLKLALEAKEASQNRSLSDMLLGDGAVETSPTSAGYGAGQRKGWAQLSPGSYVTYQTYHNGPKAKSLSVGKVIANQRPDRAITVQPHEAYWTGTRVAHRPLFQCDHSRTTEQGPHAAKDTVLYAALKQQVELLAGGELTHSSSRRLSVGGWGLLIDEVEALHLLEHVRSERTRLMSEDGLALAPQAKVENITVEGGAVAEVRPWLP